ncbi:DMT family transporter [Stenotrophomonas sp. HITSZ_GD]|uniref:DMT family transporter n=1 Tax=Stenotrophomonas sp. HITSZ_GD TaxID=3037248 RepID=UPI00240E6450|nr:DMT family transporter [Stenotrophomonas sp. HITSZ_GD]MDG2526346.1 DMT family transporter [Stenotrophomonas sp. HITSZ_GD]
MLPAPARPARPLAAGVTSGVIAGALWGLVFLAPQWLRDFTPLQMSVSRYLAYGLIALLVLAPRWRRAVAPMRAADWWTLAWLSLLGNLLYYVLLGTAVQWAGGAAASLIIGLLPVSVTLVGSRAAGAMRLSALAWPLAACVLGVALVAVQALAGAHDDAHGLGTRLAGLACAFGALLSWTAYSVGNARWLSRRPEISSQDGSLLTGVVTGALALLGAVPAFVSGATHAPADWARFWGVALVIALFASVIGNALWNRSSRLLPLTLVGQMIVFETVFALLYGFLWEQRWPSLLEALAIACLLAGVYGCTAAHVERRRAPA